MTSHCSLVYERVSVCVCSRPSMIEGAGDSAETPPPTTFESVREPSAQFTASFRPPPPLLHPLDTHTSLLRQTLCVCLGSRRRHTGDFTRCPSDGETDAAVARLLFGPSLSLLDTGLVRLIVYSLSELLQTLRSAGSAPSWSSVRRTRRVWIAGFT